MVDGEILTSPPLLARWRSKETTFFQRCAHHLIIIPLSTDYWHLQAALQHNKTSLKLEVLEFQVWTTPTFINI